MADNNVTVDPRYMTYNKDEVQALLDKVNNADVEPTAESENMITSGGVAAALGSYSTTEEMNEALGEKVDYEENGDPMSLLENDSE